MTTTRQLALPGIRTRRPRPPAYPAEFAIQCALMTWARIGELLDPKITSGDVGRGRKIASPRGEAMPKDERHRYRSLARIEAADFRAEIGIAILEEYLCLPDP